MRDSGYVPPEARQDFYLEKGRFWSEQIGLATDERDPVFLEDIERKRKELETEPEQGSIDRYIKLLGMKRKDLEGKKVLDLGTGGGEFVKECIREGLCADAIGVDVDIDEIDSSGFEENFIKADFTEPLPVEKVDLAVAVASFSAVLDKKEVESMKALLTNALNTVKKDGELRIFPVPKIGRGSGLSGLEDQMENWDELIAELERNGHSVELVPTNLNTSLNHDDVWVDQVLVIGKLKNLGENGSDK